MEPGKHPLCGPTKHQDSCCPYYYFINREDRCVNARTAPDVDGLSGSLLS